MRPMKTMESVALRNISDAIMHRAIARQSQAHTQQQGAAATRLGCTLIMGSTVLVSFQRTVSTEFLVLLSLRFVWLSSGVGKQSAGT
jgi:hypothetical protein